MTVRREHRKAGNLLAIIYTRRGGKAKFLDLTLRETQAQQRIQIRGIGYNPLLTPASAIPIAAGCNLIPTLEVFSPDTGNTPVILTEVVRLGTSIPPPPSSPGQ